MGGFEAFATALSTVSMLVTFSVSLYKLHLVSIERPASERALERFIAYRRVLNSLYRIEWSHKEGPQRRVLEGDRHGIMRI